MIQGPWSYDNQEFFISFDKEKIYRMKSGYYLTFDNAYFIQTTLFAFEGNI